MNIQETLATVLGIGTFSIAGVLSWLAIKFSRLTKHFEQVDQIEEDTKQLVADMNEVKIQLNSAQEILEDIKARMTSKGII